MHIFNLLKTGLVILVAVFGSVTMAEAAGDWYELLDATVEESCVLAVGSTPVKVECPDRPRHKTWTCTDPAAGGVTFYRGGPSVTASTGYPFSGDGDIPGNTRSAYLMKTGATVNLRCLVATE